MGLRTFILITFSVVLMVLDHEWLFFTKVRSVLNAVVSPIQYVVAWPVDLAQDIKSNFVSHSELIEDNTRLKMQVLLLQAQLQKSLAVDSENTQLRALLAASPKDVDKNMVGRVLAVDSDPYVDQVLLNRGTQDGIYVGQPALDAQGVLGQIIQVGPWTSRLMLLSDTRSGIAVNIARNGLRAIATGVGNHKDLQLINMPITSDVKEGDALVSSGLDMRYPVGYPVGTVTAVTHQKGAPYLDITVQPSANLNQSNLALLVWPQLNDTDKGVQQALTDMQQQDNSNIAQQGTP